MCHGTDGLPEGNGRLTEAVARQGVPGFRGWHRGGTDERNFAGTNRKEAELKIKIVAHAKIKKKYQDQRSLSEFWYFFYVY